MITDIAEKEGFNVRKEKEKYLLTCNINNYTYDLSIKPSNGQLLISTYMDFIYSPIENLSNILRDMKNKWKKHK